MIRALAGSAFLSSLWLLACTAPSPASVETAVTEIEIGGRSVSLHVSFAPGEPVHGVAVLSHGTFSAGDRYAAVAQPWAQAGFVVIAPDHRDARFAEVPRGVDHMIAIVASRVAEVREIATRVPDIAVAVGAQPDAWAQAPLFAAGHSVGTQVALQVTGLRIRDPQDGSEIAYPEERFVAAVLLSDPGKMAAMPADVWEAGERPVFMVTGPDDYGLMGDGRRRMSFVTEVVDVQVSPAPLRAVLSISGLDHQFGGLIHKDAATEPDYEAMAVFIEQSLVFLQWCVAGDGAAPPPQPGRLSERAVLSVTAERSAARGC